MNLQNSILKNINGLIIMLRAKGIEELSATKFLLFINEKYGVTIDQDELEELLSNNDSVAEIVDDKIILGKREADIEENTIDDEVHDMATDQAMDSLTTESFEKLNYLSVGSMLNSQEITLNENDENYLLHEGLKKSKVKYMVMDILPSKNLSESIIVCKVDKKQITINIPLTAI